MIDEINRAIEQLFGRLTGPMQFRLYLQPLMAIIMAIRAGVKDAREKKPPFFWTVLTEAEHRRRLVHSAWRDLARVLILAIVIDSIYQIIVLKTIYPLQALIVAFLLAVVPYIIFRGPVTRCIRRFRANPQ